MFLGSVTVRCGWRESGICYRAACAALVEPAEEFLWSIAVAFYDAFGATVALSESFPSARFSMCNGEGCSAAESFTARTNAQSSFSGYYPPGGPVGCGICAATSHSFSGVFSTCTTDVLPWCSAACDSSGITFFRCQYEKHWKNNAWFTFWEHVRLCLIRIPQLTVCRKWVNKKVMLSLKVILSDTDEDALLSVKQFINSTFMICWMWVGL